MIVADVGVRFVGVEPEVREGVHRRRVGAVGLVELIARDFQLLAVALEIGAVRQRGVEVDLDRRQVAEVVLEVGGEGHLFGQRAFGIAHQHRQRVDRGLVLVVGVDHGDLGVVGEDLEVQHVAQRDGAGFELVLGVLEGVELELAVFLGDPAFLDGQQHGVVGDRDAAHHGAALVGFERLLVFHGVLRREDAEFARQTVEDEQRRADGGLGGEVVRGHPAVVAAVVADVGAAVVVGAEAVLDGEARREVGRVGAPRLIVTHPRRRDRVVGGDVGRVVLEGDALGLGAGELGHVLEEFVALVLFALGIGVALGGARRRRVTVASADDECRQRAEQRGGSASVIQLHFSCSPYPAARGRKIYEISVFHIN